MPRSLQEIYDESYADEDMLRPIVPRPDAASTVCYDDAVRLLRGAGGSLLEVGGSTGRFGIALAGQFQRIVVTDISERYVRMGEAHLSRHHPRLVGKFEFIPANLDAGLSFPDATFDAVVALAVIEHVIDPFFALDEIARVMKPGGLLIVTVPNIAYVKHVIELITGRLPITGGSTRSMADMREQGWDGRHFHYFTKSSLGDLLRNTGFTAETWTGDGRWAKYRRWWSALSGNLTVRARRNETQPSR